MSTILSEVEVRGVIRRGVAALLLLLLSSANGTYGETTGGPVEARLRVAAVQLLVDERDVLSLEAFRAHMRASAREAASAGADLLVFPEYTGVLLALIPYAWAIDGSASATEALVRIRGRESAVSAVRDVLLAGSAYALRGMGEVFGMIAAEERVTVVAGTYFARGTDAQGRSVLTNRALVYAPDGSLLHSQDKVFLTEFEEGIGMLPGDPRDVHPFVVAGRPVGLTICRDTFLDIWGPAFAGVDLWIDIKANGELYTTEVEERFARALPARLRSSGVSAGMTVCLTGSLLDFVWEGPSSVILRLAGGTIETLAAAHAVRGEEILAVDLPEPWMVE